MVIFFLSYCLLFNKITLNKGNVGTNHLNNRILLFVCNRKVIYYYYITLPSITITITFGNFQSITITITGKSGYYYYNYILPHPCWGHQKLTSFGDKSDTLASSRTLLSLSGKDMWEISPSFPSISSPSRGRTRQKTLMFPCKEY